MKMKAGIKKYQEVAPVHEEEIDLKRREDLILRYAPLVKKIAERMAISLANEEIAEIKQEFNVLTVINNLYSDSPDIGRLNFVSAYE